MFLSWPGWSFIGNLAQVLSLLAIVFAIIEISARRHMVRGAVWGFEVFGHVVRSDNDQRYDAVEFYNAGTDAARIWAFSLVGAEFDQQGDKRFRFLMGQGDRLELYAKSPDIRKAWAFIGWREHKDSNFLHVRWLPLVESGDMYEEVLASMRRTPNPHWWTAPWRGRRPGKVGPGYRLSTSVREIRNREKFSKRLDVALGKLLDSSVIAQTFTPGTMYGASDHEPTA